MLLDGAGRVNVAKRGSQMKSSKIRDIVCGIYETHIPVSDLARSVNFYRDQLGFDLARMVPTRSAAFLWIGGSTRGMLGLWESGSGPLRMTLHFAFRASKDGVAHCCETLKAAGLSPLGFHGEPVEEPVVIGWMPAMSVYFNDPDGHSIELLCVLEDDPDPNFGIGPLSAWSTRIVGQK